MTKCRIRRRAVIEHWPKANGKRCSCSPFDDNNCFMFEVELLPRTFDKDTVGAIDTVDTIGGCDRLKAGSANSVWRGERTRTVGANRHSCPSWIAPDIMSLSTRVYIPRIFWRDFSFSKGFSWWDFIFKNQGTSIKNKSQQICATSFGQWLNSQRKAYMKMSEAWVDPCQVWENVI